uniref:Isoleucine--tRNA ligase, cytoplasmic n=1 Tax=Ditylenchus dipsaci TaxID=166011 RepID=A0A915DCL4_9BILA
MSNLKTVPENINFADEEVKIQKHWAEQDTFKKSLDQNKDLPRFTFYDGPPFATGLPHYGHILMGTIKDIVTRWAHQNGKHVERRFGWDTHGLPVEFEMDKILGITGPADVHKMGIAKYNQECRGIVMRYAAEWQIVVERMGRWIDFENDYKTLYPWFMESVWWVFSELHKKNLVYRGVKVMPFSTGCSTPLSNFEAGQDYQDVVDPAVFVAFALVENENRYLVAWTTTPWTLPSNMSICVHPDLDYVAVKDLASGKEYILLEQRLSEVYKKATSYEILEKFKGQVLKGKEYKPLFPYFEYLRADGKTFRVLTATFITTDQGTGVVHQAPYFGEIDFQTSLDNGVITRESKIVCPIDEKGRFTEEVPDYLGIYVKEADKLIIKRLKESGNLVKHEQCKHSYPFCWRSHTPLLYKAVASWFIRVESFVDKLLVNNSKTHWVPEAIKEKRFGNWLRDARDWSVSRNRFWGTPINLWVSEDFEEVVCPSSIAELEELTGAKLTDLHRENVDDLEIPSKINKGRVLKRVSEVFDCWFESGSMPYAQQHYPFNNSEIFDQIFPADFVCEGIDQTRGWFYTLMVLGTALFDKPPFKNLICGGLILAGDGNKMSKSKKNYPDPMEVIGEYGADALRAYLINSPAVRGENLRFRKEGVSEVVKDVFLPWFHAYRFFIQSVQYYEQSSSQKFVFRQTGFQNVMDKWILSFTNSLVEDVHREMASYKLYNVVAPLMRYFDTLTNWYVRLNRKRVKGETVEDEEDRLLATSTLGHVLVMITTLIGGRTYEDSVHFVRVPTPQKEFIDKTVERRVEAMRTVVDIVRVLRERKNISVKYPLAEVVVIHREPQFLEDLKSLESYILSELNIEKMTVSEDKHKYGVILRAEPNFKTLSRLKAAQKDVSKYLKDGVTEDELEEFLKMGKLSVCGHQLNQEDIKVSFTFDSKKQSVGKWETANGSNSCVIMINTSEDEELLGRGLAREIISRIQKLRKEAHLVQSSEAVVYCTLNPSESVLSVALKQHQKQIDKSKVKEVDIELHLVV